MPFGGANSERILILAPRGRDAEVASQLLQEAGWPTLVCPDVTRLSEEIAKGAGCAVVVEDVIASDDISGFGGQYQCAAAMVGFSDGSPDCTR